MQNTRLNTLVGQATVRLTNLFRNPWRRLSLLIISVLFGFFLGSAISTSAGQRAELDIWAAAVLVLITELVNRVVYNPNNRLGQGLPAEATNGLKMGLIYSLFLEAFKLGS